MGKFLILVISLLLLSTVFSMEINLSFDYVNDQIFRQDYYDRLELMVKVPLGGNLKYVLDGSFAHDGYRKCGWEDALLDQYWDTRRGYLEWTGKKANFKLGLQPFSAGRGNEYKLFFREEVGSFNGLNINWNPVPWFSFNNQLILVRFAPSGVSSIDGDENFAKNVYYRSYSFGPFKHLTLGFQEAILFIDRNFDPWYAFSLFPYTALQELRHMVGVRENINDNAMVGAFIEYSKPGFRGYFDFLLDDLNGNAFLRPDASPTVNKLAIDIGMEMDINDIRVSIEGAMASAYVFERTSSNRPYEYSKGEGDVISDYVIEENMLGYVYGENSASFSAKAEDSSGIYLKFENVWLGERTPWSPWHGEETYQPGTNFLLNGIVEKRRLVEAGYKSNFHLKGFEFVYELYGGLFTKDIKNISVESYPLFGCNFEIHKEL